jgi:hypothetical protein
MQNAVGFTTFNPLFKSQFVGIAGAPGAMTYAYPDTSGQGYGSVDSSQGVNFCGYSKFRCTRIYNIF